MYDPPPFYYVRSPSNGTGQWLPVARVSHAAGGHPSIFVRVQEQGDYSHPVQQTDIEYAFVQRIDYGQVARAQDSRLSQFIRPVYPPHLPHGLESRQSRRALRGDETVRQRSSPTTAPPTVKRSASVAQLTHPTSILKTKSSVAPPSYHLARERNPPSAHPQVVHGYRLAEGPISIMPPGSPVLSEATSNSTGNSSIGSGFTSSSANSSLFNVPRSARHHYTTPQKSIPSHRSGPEYRIQKPSLQALPPPGIASSTPVYQQSSRNTPRSSQHAAYATPVTGPVYQTASGNNPVEYRPDQAPVYSSFELYQSQVQPSSHGSHPPTSRPRISRRRSSSSYSGAVPQVVSFAGDAYGTGLGLGGGLGSGMEYGSKSRGSKWWKLGM